MASHPMPGFVRVTAVMCLGLLVLPLSSAVPALEASQGKTSAVQAQVRDLVVGQEVEVTMQSGARMLGALTRIDDEGISIHPRDSTIPTRLTYDQLSRIRPITVEGKALPPEAARRAAAAAGVGKTVDVQALGGKRLRARITAIDQDGFTIVHGSRDEAIVIDYGEVVLLKPAGMRGGPKAAIGIAATIGAIVGASLLYVFFMLG